MHSQKKITFSILIFLVSIYFFPMFNIQAMDNTRNIRIGFFEFPGYHNIDEDGNRSGYGYEYLHEMAKYTGWTFTYVDGTWEECQEMLKNGEIDLLTSAQKTEKREEYFAFSTLPMGENYIQLTVKNDNVYFTKNDFGHFQGMRVGFVKGSSRNILFEKFAKEKGFSYNSVYFQEIADLNQAFRNDMIDSILTSSLRELSNERVITQFAPSSFYGIVQKENKVLLSEMNAAISEIHIKNPDYEVDLHNKYYSCALSSRIFLTSEERTYLKTKPIIRVVGPPAGAPLFYFNGDTAKGIAVDILELILKDTDMKMEVLHSENYVDAINMVIRGEADVLGLFVSDFNWAKENRIRITSPYMSLGYSAISQFEFTGEHQRVAVVNGCQIDTEYIKSTYKNPIIVGLDTEEDAVRAVDKNHVDVALINTYSAQRLLYSTYPNLKATSFNAHLSNISLGVSENANPILYSILDKNVRSLDRIAVSKVIANHTVLQTYRPTLLQSMKLNPIIFVVLFACILILIISLLVYRGFTQKRHAKKIFSLAYHDALTQLWNKNGFELKTQERIQNKKRNYAFIALDNEGVSIGNSDRCAIIAVDIEGFSAVNSDYSREIGDMVIMKIGQHIQHSCGENAIIAHSHADNYLLFIEYTNEHDFKKSLEAICNLAPISIENDFLLKLRLRVGVCQTENMDIESFYIALARAEMAHHVAKTQMISVVYFDEILKLRMEQEKKIIDCFKHALEDGDFQVYYQPKFDMRNGKIIGAEGLIRWKHKELGFLFPDKFIHLLERTGDVVEIDFFVLEQACIMIKKWMDASCPVIPISVNQSRANFARAKYIERIQTLLEKYDIPRNAIEIEITENLFESQKVIQEMIEQIKSLDLSVSMDDFGSGYSSLALLKQVSIDTIKIDKSLIDDSESSPKACKILRKIVEMAHDLGLNVICEGVENKEQVKFLLEIGCNYAQGFFYSKPICETEFIALLNHKIVHVI